MALRVAQPCRNCELDLRANLVSMSLAETVDDVRTLKRELQTLGVRNAKLAQLLKAARERLDELNAQVAELAEPASTFGVFLTLDARGRDAEVFTAGRRMRVKISPDLSRAQLRPGARVRLGEGAIIVEVCGYPETGSLAVLIEHIGADRALVAAHTGEEKVVMLAHPLKGVTRAGDHLLVNDRAEIAVERIPKTEATSLCLEEVPDVSYEDIGGLDEQIEIIHDAVELPFTQPELYKTYKLDPPRGVLLYGPPGCGKTLIAKAVANSLAKRVGSGQRSYFLSVKGPELLNKYVGETERRIRMIFENARELASEGRPVVIFFDEMESLFRTRGSGVSSDMETTVVPQLLTEMDGVEGLSNVIIIGATNREELIDPALLRPGRLDVKIRVSRPDKAGARDIFTRYLDDSVPVAEPAADLIDAAVEALYTPRPYVELTLTDGTTRMLFYHDFVSGAMIANIVDRAKKLAIKEHLAACSTTPGTTGHCGVARKHLIAAVLEEQRESEDLPDTSNPDEWARITGRQGMRVCHARVVN